MGINVDRLIDEGVPPEEALAAMVIKLGLEIDGPCYLTFPCARDWISVVGIHPEVLWKSAVRGTDHEGLPFEELTCAHAKRINAWWYVRAACDHVKRGDLDYHKIEGRPGFWVSDKEEITNHAIG